MKTSAIGIQFISSWEKFRPDAYRDDKGLWTIGYGHRGNEAFSGNTITQAHALQLLSADLAFAENHINWAIKVPLAQYQFDALVSLTFNIGTHAFQASSVCRDVNNRSWNMAGDSFLKYCKETRAGVLVEDQGLMNRRESERRIFLAIRPVQEELH